MYIRIQDNVVRFRVSKQEAQSLLNGNSLTDQLVLSADQNLIYKITPTENSSYFSFITSTNQFLLNINLTELKTEINDRPSKSGILIEKNDEIQREVYLEVDIKKPKTI